MDEEKLAIRLDRDVDLARLILDTADKLAKMPPKDWKSGDAAPAYRFSLEHVRDAADLTFLALDLIAERRK